jgi:hypothetical protein
MVNEMREKAKSGNARVQKQQEEASNSTMTTRTLKICHAGPTWIRSTSFSVLLSEVPWSQNSCHNPYSAWASLKWAGGTLARSALYALDERRLVGTDIPDLSTIAGVRSGTIGAAL